MKQKILHIIDSFSKGGAEVLLAGAIPELTDYEHVIIYLMATKSPILSFDTPNIKIECINYKGTLDAGRIIKKLNTIIEIEKPKLIHTHLYFSSIFIRFANTRQTKIIQTYHNEYYRIRYPKYIAQIKKTCMKLIDRYTMKKSYTIIHVSKAQQQVNDFDVKIKSSSVFYNYVEDTFYSQRRTVPFNNINKLKIICVGNLKTEKNHILLLHALKQLKHIPMHVNICGEGNDHVMLQQFINKYALPVTILGSKNNIREMLDQHDLYVSCSIIEGFGISVAEAMASEIPILVSNISTFKEITENKTLFFESNDENDLAEKIEAFYLDPLSADRHTLNCKAVAEKYRKSTYVEKLNRLYQSIISVD